MERKEGVKEGGVCALWNPALDVCLAPKAAVTKDGGAAGWEMGLRDREDRRQTEEGGGGGRRGCGGWTWREGGRVVWVEEGEEERVLGWKEREGGREGEWRLLTPAEEEKEEKKKGFGDSCRLEVVRHEWMGKKQREGIGGKVTTTWTSSASTAAAPTDYFNLEKIASPNVDAYPPFLPPSLLRPRRRRSLPPRVRLVPALPLRLHRRQRQGMCPPSLPSFLPQIVLAAPSVLLR